jgi:hypothetical protein
MDFNPNISTVICISSYIHFVVILGVVFHLTSHECVYLLTPWQYNVCRALASHEYVLFPLTYMPWLGWYCCLEMGTSSIIWAQQSRFYLMTEAESSLQNVMFLIILGWWDRLCGLVVSVADYKHRGHGFDSRALLRILLRELGLERRPLSLMIG